MSPSLRNLAPEYVKTHMKNVKLPLASSRRFNVKPRIRDRLRSLKAELMGLLHESRQGSVNVKLGLVGESNHRGLDGPAGKSPVSLLSDTCHNEDDEHEEELPTPFVVNNYQDFPAEEAPVLDSEQDFLCAHDITQTPIHSVGLNIQYLGGCSLKAHLNDEIPVDDPNSDNSSPDSSLGDVVIGSAACFSFEAGSEFTHSPVSGDILTALDAFEADDALSVSHSGAPGPVRSLQTIWEEDSTMFHSSCSVDAQSLLSEGVSAASVSPDESNAAQANISFAHPPRTISMQFSGIASGATQVQRTSYFCVMPPYSRMFASSLWDSQPAVEDVQGVLEAGEDDVD